MQFSKYSASGNDFIIFHTFKRADFSALARKLCDRHEGLGADGLIALIPHETLDFEWLFYNSDGSSATMCGNGTRACGLYAFENGLCGSKMGFLSGAGTINVEVFSDGVESQLSKADIIKNGVFEHGLAWTLIDTGVPHLVTFTNEIYALPKDMLAELRHKYNANVNIGTVREGAIKARTFERGVEDETLACGTGMAALFFRAFTQGIVPSSATVVPKSGERLEFKIEEGKIFFKGKVKKVFDTISYPF